MLKRFIAMANFVEDVMATVRGRGEDKTYVYLSKDPVLLEPNCASEEIRRRQALSQLARPIPSRSAPSRNSPWHLWLCVTRSWTSLDFLLNVSGAHVASVLLAALLEGTRPSLHFSRSFPFTALSYPPAYHSRRYTKPSGNTSSKIDHALLNTYDYRVQNPRL